MNFSLIIIIIFGILTLLLLVLLYYINKLIIYKNRIDHAYQAVSDLMEERIDYIERFSVLIETELKTENNLINKLEKLVKEYNTEKKDIKFLKKTSKYLKIVKDLDKIYPFLKDRHLYETLTKESDLNQERIEYAMDTYDKEVTNYNNYIENKYINILKELFKFPDYDYYKKK